MFSTILTNRHIFRYNPYQQTYLPVCTHIMMPPCNTKLKKSAHQGIRCTATGKLCTGKLLHIKRLCGRTTDCCDNAWRIQSVLRHWKLHIRV